MPRKIFLSFLGISNYEPVSYYVARSAHTGAPEKYVQKSILDHLATTFGAQDHAYIFLTDEARTANWQNDGHQNFKTKEALPNTGLQQLLAGAAYSFSVTDVSVNGESEPAAIWETFEAVFHCIEAEDEVYLDITHSWRYLPMLGMTLLNYAKVIKRIRVQAIYYGAFEQLGLAQEVRQLPLDERPVPVLNLVSFSELQDWTIAADDFVQDGNPTRLAQLTNNNLSGIPRDSSGEDEIARNLNQITGALNRLVPLISTNRGQEIWNFNYQSLAQALAAFSAERSYLKPLNGVVEHIRQKLAGFQPDGQLQWLEAVHWCIQHGLTQQGITQLQEGLISWLCLYYEDKGWAEAGYFDPHANRKGRDLLSSALQFIEHMPPEEKWSGQVGLHKELTYRIMQDKLPQQLAKSFRLLAITRNDINHGGYTKTTKAAVFYERLRNCYADIRKVLAAFQQQAGIGLLNLSNHPAQRWSATQYQAALNQFGSVQDLPFPAIDPTLDANGIHTLVAEYYEQVLELAPKAVHLMGEMTFTHALVQRLKAAGIPCLASTSERLVEERDGKKTVTFNFIQFRPY